jgi:hypothetical protein
MVIAWYRQEQNGRDDSARIMPVMALRQLPRFPFLKDGPRPRQVVETDAARDRDQVGR